MMNTMAIMQSLAQFKANPLEMLSKRFNIPTEIGNNPNDILQHLINSGQVSQTQVDQVMQMRSLFSRS